MLKIPVCPTIYLENLHSYLSKTDTNDYEWVRNRFIKISPDIHMKYYEKILFLYPLIMKGMKSYLFIHFEFL